MIFGAQKRCMGNANRQDVFVTNNDVREDRFPEFRQKTRLEVSEQNYMNYCRKSVILIRLLGIAPIM